MYKHDYIKTWNEKTRPWFHAQNVWPYLVDTRRTVDPDFEVSPKQRDQMCKSAEKKRFGESAPAVINLREATGFAQNRGENHKRQKSAERIERFNNSVHGQRRGSLHERRSRQDEDLQSVQSRSVNRAKSVSNLRIDFQPEGPADEGYASIEMRRRGLSQNSRRSSWVDDGVARAGEENPREYFRFIRGWKRRFMVKKDRGVLIKVTKPQKSRPRVNKE